MANNPLQQYFRQPKIFISLPSKGVYNKPGTLTGDPTNIPVFSMTGMDEIILKTPDALLTGESTVRVVESCCQNIKDGWDVSVLDMPLIFAAMRIATFGNTMSVDHTCSKCGAENEYDLDLNKIVEHYLQCNYDSKVMVNDLVIKTRPLNYKESTEFNLKNFRLQQRLAQSDDIEDRTEQQKMINQLFQELSLIQNDLYVHCVDSVELPGTVVTEQSFIKEWLQQCDKEVYDAIKRQIEKNREIWKNPTFPVKCDSCGNEVNLAVELDQSNFFGKA
jgi:DNA-directed RNA polymerase subunit RPC12/RpoP